MSFDSLGFRRAVICCVLVGGFLSACGGSGEQTGATDLYGAYEVIDGGMTEAQAKAVIGAEPDARQSDGSRVWEWGQVLTFAFCWRLFVGQIQA